MSLVNWDNARLQGGGALGIAVRAYHFVAGLCQARPGGQPHVTATNYGNSQFSTAILPQTSHARSETGSRDAINRHFRDGASSLCRAGKSARWSSERSVGDSLAAPESTIPSARCSTTVQPENLCNSSACRNRVNPRKALPGDSCGITNCLRMK